MTKRNSGSSSVRDLDARQEDNTLNSSTRNDAFTRPALGGLCASLLGLMLVPALAAGDARRTDGPAEPPYIPDAPALAVSDATMPEGNGGAAVLRFRVTLSPESTVPVMVSYRILDRTASGADGDYQAAHGTATIPAHTAASEICVTVYGDLDQEADESLSLFVDAATNARIADGVATGLITNDDFNGDGGGRDPRKKPVLHAEGGDRVVPGPDDPPPGHGAPITLSISDNSVAEGGEGSSPLQFKVELSQESQAPITLSYRLVDGSALCSDRDYQAATGTVTIPARRTSSVIGITIFGDAVRESDETFQLVVTGVANAQMASDVATGMILNDDMESGGGEGGGPRRRPGYTSTESVMPIGVSFSVVSDNPVRGKPSFMFTLNRASHVSIAIYDVAGRMVGTPVEGNYSTGRHFQTLSHFKPAPGVYLVSFRTDGQTVTRRITWLD